MGSAFVDARASPRPWTFGPWIVWIVRSKKVRRFVKHNIFDFQSLSLKLDAIYAMPSVEWATDVWIRLPLVIAASAYVGAVRGWV